MLPSLLCAVLYAGSGICGQRAAVALGSIPANALRLVIATFGLALLASQFGAVDFHSRTSHWLLVSGAVGFGLGDVALFLAYPRLGSRLTLLIMLCSAPLFGSLGDWMLLGTTVTMAQAVSGMVILTGVGLALSQGIRIPTLQASAFLPGVMFASVAGFGQGFGTSISRYAQMTGEGTAPPNGITQAFVRVVAGMVVALAVWAVHAVINRSSPRKAGTVNQPKIRGATAWLVGTALCGPVFGVSCFQWALLSSQSAVVLSITSITPVLIIPLAAYIERDEPGPLALIGAAIAVAGVVLMSFWVVV